MASRSEPEESEASNDEECTVMVDIAVRLANSRSFASVAALHASAPFRAGAMELLPATACEIIKVLGMRDRASLICTSPSIAAAVAQFIDADVTVLMCKYNESFTAHEDEVGQRFGRSLTQEQYAQANCDYEELAMVYYENYADHIRWVSSEIHRILPGLSVATPERCAVALGVVAGSICGSSFARSIGSGWDVGIEDLWYRGLYGEAEHALDVIKRCGLPRAVFAETESDFERDDEEFQGLGGMGDGDGDD